MEEGGRAGLSMRNSYYVKNKPQNNDVPSVLQSLVVQLVDLILLHLINTN